MTLDPRNYVMPTSRVKVGSLLEFEVGEYGDSSRYGPYKVLREFDRDEAVKLYREQWASSSNKKRDETDSFMDWLKVQGYIAFDVYEVFCLLKYWRVWETRL